VRVAAGVLVLVGLGLVGLALFLAPGQSAPAAQAQVNSNSVQDGRLLYIQNCASCHGAAGEGSSVAPPLTNAGPAALDFYMRTGRMPLARIGTPGYEQPPQLTQDQIAAILSYASGFSHGPQIPTVTTGADLSRGWQLYVNNCAACHGPAAAGGSVGAGVTAPALTGRDQLTIAEAMLVGPGAMPQFNFAQPDVNAITTYIESLNTPPAPGGFPIPGSGPVVEGVIAAVLGIATLIVISHWVARRGSLPETPTERQDAHGEDEA
jgi:quinol---cytochrome-c reductase cytochrome c subunit